MSTIDRLVDVANQAQFPEEAIAASGIILVHDLAVAASAIPLLESLLDGPHSSDTEATDITTGKRMSISDAVTRNGQLVHAFTQDDTLLPAMTHVGATSIPVLLAIAEVEGVHLSDVVRALTASFAAAEILGRPVAPRLAAVGVRPTPLIGPMAAQVGLANMLGWDPDRVRRAVARVAAVAGGTSQPWVDGSQEWLFQIAASGQLALSAARSSASAWAFGSDPLWGPAGLFTCFGLKPGPDDYEMGDLTASTRASIKRFPACAINQVPLVLVQRGERAAPSTRQVRVELSTPEATYPGTNRTAGLDTWSARLMSLQYCVSVMAVTGDFTVDDLQRQPDAVTPSDLDGVEIVATDLPIGTYRVAVEGRAVVESSTSAIGVPTADELAIAATTAVGQERVTAMLTAIDRNQPGKMLTELVAAR
jgi:2-methylcitrate dehydratase PrpD